MTTPTRRSCGGAVRILTAVASICLTFGVHSLILAAQGSGQQRTFATPEDAVRALTAAAKAGNMDELRAIFGPEGQELIASSDEATARRNREVFTVAVAEGWRLLDQGRNRKALVVGNEGWPFPVPLVKTRTGGDSTPQRERKKCSRAGSAATSWR